MEILYSKLQTSFDLSDVNAPNKSLVACCWSALVNNHYYYMSLVDCKAKKLDIFAHLVRELRTNNCNKSKIRNSFIIKNY